MSDPFSSRNGARMYRTGDIGRWREDGAIDLGRATLRSRSTAFGSSWGNRSGVAATAPGVGQAVVVAREDQLGAKRLVAYVSGREGADRVQRCASRCKRSARVHGAGRLRAAADSAAQCQRQAGSRGAAGTDGGREHADTSPRAAGAQALAAMWQQLLKVGRVGRQDNFFALGGHSILALSLIERMRRRGMRADLRALFTHTGLAGLAATVRAGGQEPATPQNGIPSGASASPRRCCRW